ncbi:nuclear transport factor 2 family protein [Amycolatopsis azurea]|uniref:nuclear transport factor 2 family protein n=1 Tax=Amycolatopsis azurea TaxID=36819 RepID=UPI003821C87E
MTASNLQIVQNAWKAFGTYDPERIAEVFTEDAEWHAPPGNATAIALEGPNRLVGREAIVRFLAEDFRKLFVSDVSLEFHGFHPAGDTVVVEETMTAKLPDGSVYSNDYCFLFLVSEGRIHRVREYMDTARGHRQLEGIRPLSRAPRVGRSSSRTWRSGHTALHEPRPQ